MTTIDKPNVVIRADWVSGPKQGEWTYEHYAALPNDGQRYEIINGVLYMVPSPSGSHQDAELEIASYLRTFVKLQGRGLVRVSPFDILLTTGTLVQPDIFVFLKTNAARITDKRIFGVPDLAIEIASPSTALFDRREKYDAYEQAGVPEYWLVDTSTQSIEVLVLKENVYQSRGYFSGKAGIPSIIVPELEAIPVEQFFL